MTAANDNSRWDRGRLAEWRAGHSEERKAKDAKLLKDIFNFAAQVPQLKEALDWAQANDIEFVIDRTTTANAYYCTGAGVVALSADVLKRPAWAVGTVTHEIRHAWQDYHGLLGRPDGRFSEYFTAVALTEADAEAFAARARDQYALSSRRASYQRGPYKLLPMRSSIKKLDREIEKLQKNPEALWSGFKKWFQCGRSLPYGTRSMRAVASDLGVPGISPQNCNFEFRPFDGRKTPVASVPDFRDWQQLHRLGRGFSGKNYFDEKGRRQQLQYLFNPEFAERFYNSQSARPAIMDEIRKRALRVKLQGNAKRKQPLPA